MSVYCIGPVCMNVPLFQSEKGKLSRLTLTSEALIFERAFHFSSGISVHVIYLATQIREAEALKWVIKIIFIGRLHLKKKKKKSGYKVPAHRHRAEGRWCWQELMETETDQSEQAKQIHKTQQKNPKRVTVHERAAGTYLNLGWAILTHAVCIALITPSGINRFTGLQGDVQGFRWQIHGEIEGRNGS